MQRYAALLKVKEVGSFTKAAELLGVTQPALSQMVASLERELGMKLLVRSRAGARLTPEGERLFPAMEQAVARYRTMREKADEILGLESGVVRIGTVSSVSCHWLPGVIEQFWAAHPAIEIVLLQGDYTTIPEWVRTGAVDFGFVNPAAVKGMDTMFVKSGEFLAVLPANHPLAGRAALRPEDLAKEPFLLLEEGAWSEPLEAFRAAGVSPQVRLRMHDDYSILSMVEQGLGVSMLAKLVLRKTSYRIAAVPMDPPVIRTLSLVMKDRESLTLAARAFIECLMANQSSLV